MRITSYSPSISAYVAVRQKDGGDIFYDLSNDIESGTIRRMVDTPSYFKLSLQNKDGKYNNLFTPMDRISISLNKNGRAEHVFTGYIKTVDRFRLYPNKFSMDGKCSLYRLQRLYFDPGNAELLQLMLREKGNLSFKQASEYPNLMIKLLTTIAGYSADDIVFGKMPDSVIEWAIKIWQSKQEDFTQANQLIAEFYDILNSVYAVTSTDPTSGYSGTASSAAVEAAVKWALAVAADDSHGYSMANRTGPDYDCSSFVYYSLLNNGWTTDQLQGYPFNTTLMVSVLEGCGWKAYSYNGDVSTLKRGDIMLSSGHTEWYIGNGQTCGAHTDYDGRLGDSSGNEVSVVNLSPSLFTQYLRFEGL